MRLLQKTQMGMQDGMFIIVLRCPFPNGRSDLIGDARASYWQNAWTNHAHVTGCHRTFTGEIKTGSTDALSRRESDKRQSHILDLFDFQRFAMKFLSDTTARGIFYRYRI
jgi:hypothetical protein